MLTLQQKLEKAKMLKSGMSSKDVAQLEAITSRTNEIAAEHKAADIRMGRKGNDRCGCAACNLFR